MMDIIQYVLPRRTASNDAIGISCIGRQANRSAQHQGNLMISNWLSAALARRNIHYGWVMVGVTFLTALITRRHGRRARRLHRAAAAGIRLDHRGDFLGAVDPLHPVRADGAVRGSPAEPLRPAQRDAVGAADRGLGAGGLAGDDEGLAADAAVGRGGRHRHRHDRAGARRHRRRALVRGAARAGGRHSHRERRPPDNWCSCRCWRA